MNKEFLQLHSEKSDEINAQRSARAMHLYDADFVCDVQSIIVTCQTNVGFLLAIRSVNEIV